MCYIYRLQSICPLVRLIPSLYSIMVSYGSHYVSSCHLAMLNFPKFRQPELKDSLISRWSTLYRLSLFSGYVFTASPSGFGNRVWVNPQRAGGGDFVKPSSFGGRDAPVSTQNRFGALNTPSSFAGGGQKDENEKHLWVWFPSCYIAFISSKKSLTWRV